MGSKTSRNLIPNGDRVKTFCNHEHIENKYNKAWAGPRSVAILCTVTLAATAT